MTTKNGKQAGITIALIVAITLSLLYLVNASFLEVLEDKTLDLRFTLRGKTTPGPETVIAAIDEKSISKLGRFPWSRSVWARVVDRLTDEGAAAVVFDVLFTETENAEADDLLQRAIRRNGRVILPMDFDFSESGYKESGFTNKPVDSLIPSAYSVLRNTDAPYSPLVAKVVLPPLERLSAYAESIAHINMIPDNDGTLRWEILSVKYHDD
jgi:adenylate cyclase